MIGPRYRAWFIVAALSSCAIMGVVAVAGPEATQGNSLLAQPEVAARVAAELSARRVDRQPGDTRGGREVFDTVAPAVPVIIAPEGSGSGVVIRRADATGLVVTNHHVVSVPFRPESGPPFVVLIFYDMRLARDVLDRERVTRCLVGKDKTPWCAILFQATRIAEVVAFDPDRDLALLRTSESLPPAVRPPLIGNVEQLRPGDEVAVIGHPLGLLWSLTTGIVSGVRVNYRVGGGSASPGVTMIQTQAPVNPGNSGGPLLTLGGQLVGIIVGSFTVPASDTNAEQIAAPGLNFAIAVNEVRAFVVKNSR